MKTIKKKNLWVIVFISVSIILFLLNLKERPAAESSGSPSKIILNKEKFYVLTDSIKHLLDTGFYAEYRVGKLGFVFYEMKKDTIADIFKVGSSRTNEIFDKLHSLGVTRVWKYNSENFYRYELYFDWKSRPQLLVLPLSSSSFFVRTASKIREAAIVDTMESLIGGVSKPTLWKVASRLWLFYPVHSY